MSDDNETDGIVAYKAFDKDFKCRGMQYAVGQTFTHAGAVVPCESGLHACERPLDVLRYYPPGTSRFAVVRATGKIARHEDDSKIAAASMTIEAEIDLPEIISKTIAWTLARCTPAEGAVSDKDNASVCVDENNKAATASGDYGAATASGYSGVATASGHSGAATASGRNGMARGKDGCALFLVYRDDQRRIVHAKAAIVGEDGIKPDTFYRLSADGQFVEAEA
jgi:hypothetical protein